MTRACSLPESVPVRATGAGYPEAGDGECAPPAATHQASYVPEEERFSAVTQGEGVVQAR